MADFVFFERKTSTQTNIADLYMIVYAHVPKINSEQV